MATYVVTRGLQTILPLVLGLSCVIALLMYMQHNDNARLRKEAQRYEKCKAESLNPPPPFKSSLDCIGWREKFKPLNPGFPAEG